MFLYTSSTRECPTVSAFTPGGGRQISQVSGLFMVHASSARSVICDVAETGDGSDAHPSLGRA